MESDYIPCLRSNNDDIDQTSEEFGAHPIHRFIVMQGHKFQNYPAELTKLPTTGIRSQYPFGNGHQNKIGIKKSNTLNLM